MTIELIISGIAVLLTVITNIAVMAYFAGMLKSNQIHQKEMLELLQKEFKENLFAALDNDVDGISYDAKMILVHNLLVDYEKENEVKTKKIILAKN